MKRIQQGAIATVFGMMLSGSVWATTMSADDAEDLLQDGGFTRISELEFRDGSWHGTAMKQDGERVDVRIDPNDRHVSWSGSTEKRTTTITTTETSQPPMRVAMSGQPVVIEEIIEVPVTRVPIIVEKRVLVPSGGRISRDDVRMVLTSAGYHDVHDIDWLSKRGVWKAEARDATGDDREIHVDPQDGRILHVEND